MICPRASGRMRTGHLRAYGLPTRSDAQECLPACDRQCGYPGSASIYTPGFSLAKAGVMLIDMQPYTGRSARARTHGQLAGT